MGGLAGGRREGEGGEGRELWPWNEACCLLKGCDGHSIWRQDWQTEVGLRIGHT